MNFSLYPKMCIPTQRGLFWEFPRHHHPAGSAFWTWGQKYARISVEISGLALSLHHSYPPQTPPKLPQWLGVELRMVFFLQRWNIHQKLLSLPHPSQRVVMVARKRDCVCVCMHVRMHACSHIYMGLWHAHLIGISEFLCACVSCG